MNKKMHIILLVVCFILIIVLAVIYFASYKTYKGKIVQITTYERVSDMSTSLGEVYTNTYIVFEMVDSEGKNEYHYFHTNDIKIMNKWHTIDVIELKEGDIIKIFKNIRKHQMGYAENMIYNDEIITPIRNINLVKVIE